MKSQPSVWSLLSEMNAPNGPKPKYGCAMVSCDKPLSLVLVDGFVPDGKIIVGPQEGVCTGLKIAPKRSHRETEELKSSTE